jgi:hypothetical protein
VTSFPVFQNRDGYGKGYPWAINPEYRHVDPNEYPAAIAMLDSSLVICDEIHPIFIQPIELMEEYAAAFRKVLADPARLLKPA